MTPLRKRMIEDLQLKGMGERTQQMYVRSVGQLAEHYSEAPRLQGGASFKDKESIHPRSQSGGFCWIFINGYRRREPP